MTIEQYSFNFNIEKFRSDFNNKLIKYISIIDDLENIKQYEEDIANIESKKNILESELNKCKSELICLSVNSLKSTGNKSQILDLISSTFFQLDRDLDSIYWNEKEYFKNVILELLKS